MEREGQGARVGVKGKDMLLVKTSAVAAAPPWLRKNVWLEQDMLLVVEEEVLVRMKRQELQSQEVLLKFHLHHYLAPVKK